MLQKHIATVVAILLLTPLLFLLYPGLGEGLVRRSDEATQMATAVTAGATSGATTTPIALNTSTPYPTVAARPGQSRAPSIGTPTTIVGSSATPAATPVSASDPAGGIALGAYVSSAPWDPLKIDEFAQTIGAAPTIVMWYQNWAGGDSEKLAFAPGAMDEVVRRGAMPLITWEPWDPEGGIVQPRFALRTILAGDHDAFVRGWARDAARWNQPFYLRFAPEMNGDWYPWSPRVSGNTAPEYVAAWRHVRDIFREEGATNVRWVWSPNVADEYTTPFAAVYPGDDQVDWIGIVGYNWGTSQSWSGWLSLADYYSATYDALVALADKPLMIAELACTEEGGDKAAWISQGLLIDIPTRFPKVQALIWFQEQKETDWRVDSSDASLAAFRRVASSPQYQGRLP